MYSLLDLILMISESWENEPVLDLFWLYNFVVENLGIDGRVAMKLTFGIKAPGIKIKIRRESKVSLSTVIHSFLYEIAYWLYFSICAWNGWPMIECASVFGYVNIYLLYFLFPYSFSCVGVNSVILLHIDYNRWIANYFQELMMMKKLQLEHMILLPWSIGVLGPSLIFQWEDCFILLSFFHF